MATKKKAVKAAPVAQEKFDEMENIEQSEIVFMNTKRTYDQYQTLDAQILADAHTNSQNIQASALQILQNGIETANLVSKQAIKHADVACDRIWNVDEQGYTVADILNDSKFQDGMASLFAKAIADGLTTEE